ncbi:MAG: VanZ family protein, partial [Acidimicrobiia bacterium]
MAVWGNEAQIAFVLFAAALPLALIPLVYFHYKRHGRFSGWTAFLTIATFLYVAGLVAFTLFPLPNTATDYCDARTSGVTWQFVPFSSLADIASEVSAVGVVGAASSVVVLQVVFNILLLVPLGMLLAYRYKRSFGFTVAFGLGISLVIELTQGTAVWGLFECPYRLADVDDLITNTLGAAIGWVIGRALTPYLPDADPPRANDDDPPRPSRRVLAGALDILAYLVVGV